MDFSSSIHPDQKTLLGFISDDLNDDLMEVVAAHVETCPSCQTNLDRLSKMAPSVAELFDKLTMDSAAGQSGTNEKSQTENQLECQFEVGEQIAKGGMGVVYRAFDHELGRNVALKIMSGQRDQKSALYRFQREARLSGQLQHPGIVPIHKLGLLDDGRPYIAMKLIEGETLAKLISKRSQSPSQHAQLLDVFGQICQVIAYAHSRNIIHRDLKPQNTMVGSFGEVQVMDWGLAKEVSAGEDSSASTIDQRQDALSSDRTAVGAILGTPAYMPPEQANAQQADARADVFSLGGILCEILTGKPPFLAETPQQAHELARAADLDQAFHRLEDCEREPELITLAKQCLCPDVNERPANAEEVHRRFSEFTDRRDEKLRAVEIARAKTKAELVVETKRRRQVAKMSWAIAAIMLCTTVATYFYWSERTARQSEEIELQRVAIEKVRKDEDAIRSILQVARSIEFDAAAAPDADQAVLWTNALKQANKAEGLMANQVSPELRQEFKAYQQHITKASKLAEEKRRLRQKEEQVFQALEQVMLDTGNADEQLRIGPSMQLLQQFEDAFASFGIRVGDDDQQVAKLVQDSRIRDQLVLGLHEWFHQAIYLRIHNEREGYRAWLRKLVDCVDPDEYRIELRKQIGQRNFARLLELTTQKETYESPLTISIVLNAMYFPTAKERSAIGNSKWGSARLAFLQRANLIYPNNFMVNFELGSYFRSQMQPKQSLPHWFACLSLKPNHIGIMVNLVNCLRDCGRMEEAIAYNERFLATHPSQAELSNSLAVSFSQIGRNREGLELARRSAELRPNDRRAQFNRHILAQRCGLYPEAIDAAKRCLELDPKKPINYSYVAQLYIETQQYDEAIKYGTKFLQLAPRSPTAMSQMAEIYCGLQQYSKAFVTYEKLIAMYPNQKQHQLDYGRRLIEHGTYGQADFILKKMVPKNAQQELTRASLRVLSLQKQGKPKRAASLADEFFESKKVDSLAKPESEEVQERLAALNAARKLK